MRPERSHIASNPSAAGGWTRLSAISDTTLWRGFSPGRQGYRDNDATRVSVECNEPRQDWLRHPSTSSSSAPYESVTPESTRIQERLCDGQRSPHTQLCNYGVGSGWRHETGQKYIQISKQAGRCRECAGQPGPKHSCPCACQDEAGTKARRCSQSAVLPYSETCAM